MPLFGVPQFLSWSPTISASTPGAGATYTVNSAQYFQFGKFVLAFIDVTITAAGTAGGNLQSTLPVNAEAAGLSLVTGNEIASGGYQIGGTIGAANQVIFRKYDVSSIIITGHHHRLAVIYMAA